MFSADPSGNGRNAGVDMAAHLRVEAATASIGWGGGGRPVGMATSGVVRGEGGGACGYRWGAKCGVERRVERKAVGGEGQRWQLQQHHG